MYKVMIVDDEPWTIVDIEQTFELDKMGFEIIGSYRTPQKALPAIVAQKPDLVITDIRMPGMTGIELMEKVRSHRIPCEFIVVSGYSDFTYAKEAIAYGVTGYCLKPLNPEETKSCLLRAKENLDVKKAASDSISHVNMDMDSNFEKMINYINTHFSEKLILKTLANDFNMNPNYCCSLFTKYLSQTFSQYLTDIRIKEAQSLLRTTSHSLEAVAEMTGYNDYFYFSKVFKKQCDCSPREYRRLYNTNKEF